MIFRRLRRHRSGMLFGALLCSVFGAPICWSNNVSERRFDIAIEARELRPAMEAFQAATHVTFWYPMDVPGSDRIRVNAVQGKLTPTETLDALFAGTGVTYEIVENTAVLDTSGVRALDSSVPTDHAEPGGNSSGPEEEEPREKLDCSEYGRERRRSEDGPTGKDCVRVLSRRTVEEMLLDEDDRDASFVLDQEQIEHRQSFTPVDVLQEFPLGTGGFAPGVMPGIPGANPMAIAPVRILVDGRQVPGVYANGAALPAISGLPMPALDRIVVYRETWFGVNGGSSGGKTVNFVVSRECEGPRLRVDLGNSFESGSGGHRVYGSFCYVMFSDIELQVKAQVSHQETLHVGDRDFVESARAAMLANNTQSLFTNSTPMLGAHPNIKFTDTNGPASNTTLSPEEMQSRDVAAAARHAGTVNTGLANSAQALGGRYASLRDGGDSHFLDLSLKRSVADVSALLNFVASEANTHILTSAADSVDLHNVFVAADAPGNFLHRDLVISVPMEGVDSDLARKLTDRQVRLTLKYEPRETPLAASLDAFASRSTFSWHQPTAAGAAAAIASGSVDVFNLDALGLMPWVEDYFSPGQRSESWQVRAEVARAIWLTKNSDLLLEAHVDRGENTFKGGDELMQGRQESAPRTFATLSPQSQLVTGAWLEASYAFYPKLPGLYSLNVRVAGRLDEYRKVSREQKCFPTCSPDAIPDRTEYRAVNPSLAVRYEPGRKWMLEGRFSEGVRIPFGTEITGIATRAVPVATFPGLQGVAASDLALLYVGGNPAIDPERLRSWSVGFFFAPSFVKDLSLSFDYTSVTKENEIIDPTEFASTNFSLFAFRYPKSIRSLSPSQNPYGATVGIDLRARNVSRVKSQALEATVQYRHQVPYGFEMRVFTQLHSQLSLMRQASPSSPWEDNAALTAYSPGHFAGVNDLSFRRGPLSFGFLSRYAGGYRNPGDTSAIGPRFYQDMYMSYRFGILGASTSTVDVQLGVANIFGKSPRTDLTQLNLIDPRDDPRLRTFLLTGTVRF